MKFLKWLLIILVVLGLLSYFFIWPYMQEQTKKISPEETNTYVQNGFDLSVNYSSPAKKDRVIFGELVPYNAVWRTGANEPTTFTTANAIRIDDQELPAGTYSLWTIPGEENWSVIFNTEIPDWGVSLFSGGKETARTPEKDIIKVEVPVVETATTIEKFTIDFSDNQNLSMDISWDTTMIKVPIKK